MRWPWLLWWRVVFWWKRRTGWIDLGERITAIGTVIQVGPNDLDGDLNFDVQLDAGQERLITGFGGRLTSAADSGAPSLHCEVSPWAPAALRAAAGALQVGQRVRVSGAWGFDGVHTGRAEWVEVLLALVRHQPAVRTGWMECHPVDALEVLPAIAPPPPAP